MSNDNEERATMRAAGESQSFVPLGCEQCNNHPNTVNFQLQASKLRSSDRRSPPGCHYSRRSRGSGLFPRELYILGLVSREKRKRSLLVHEQDVMEQTGCIVQSSYVNVQSVTPRRT